MYLPVTGASMLMLCLAGAELTCYLQRVAGERRAEAEQIERNELNAVERQRSFNRMWQELADSRGSDAVPTTVMAELQLLFSANLVAAWHADGVRGFRLAGLHPASDDVKVRLERIAQMSPCFDKLRQTQQLICASNLELDTSKAFAWFCDDNGYQHVILCPVLVRHDLVGALGFFYADKPCTASRTTEEMQSAANLFLCAF